jgi:type I restriction enzyme, R subunit
VVTSPNFAFLSKHSELLVKYCSLAEKYVFDDPNSALIKLRQVAEMLAKMAAMHTGILVESGDSFQIILNDLSDRRVITPEIADIFHGLRKQGNAAAHEDSGTQRESLYQLKMARNLAVWFHKSFGKDPNFKPDPFMPPPDPQAAEKNLKAELDQMRQELAQVQIDAEHIKHTAELEAKRRAEAEAQAKKAYEDLDAALALAEQTEAQLNAEVGRFNEQLQVQQVNLSEQADSKEIIKLAIEKAQEAAKAFDLSEADTRRLIDAQLREAGWEADTFAITFSNGVRPQKGKDIAIAEWPTTSGPADYVLFSGLTPLAVIEAKKKNKDVRGAIVQAKRYSRDYTAIAGEKLPGGPWGEYTIPFLFSTNGRPFLQQIKTKSGIWFLDARKATNHPRALEGWYTPDGLKYLLKQDDDAAKAQLEAESTDYLPLRDYQKLALTKVEEAIAKSQRELLVAMATGTGKTRTAICMCYRLIKAKRFRRILFLVDRNALGEQAVNAFKDVRLENYQSFTDIYNVKELGDLVPDKDTRLHITTVQGLMRRIFFNDDGALPVDAYDCIIIDECHRGYNLDREMTEAELSFRSEADYISKYRRVLDHFDAVKIGLTATPALHTSEIFGPPVFQYSYRQAVIDGWLIDHEPPVRIVTELAKKGMKWKKGDTMEIYKVKKDVVESYKLPDEVHIEIEKFNTLVLTENFNKVVCEELARQIDPFMEGKTLIFCANDSHADIVVELLPKAFEAQYGAMDDNMIEKITGSIDKPLQQIRHFKNERLPKVAVTVDLLTTGIDVPEIVNLVFIRRVRSRILYEQMLGRATRLCEEIGKEYFRIFDAVDLYSALEDYNTMRPVVTNPTITFAQLSEELTKVDDPEALRQIKDQFVAKWQRKKSTITEKALDAFKAATSMSPEDFTAHIKKTTPKELRAWLAKHELLIKLLDAPFDTYDSYKIISNHGDDLHEVTHGYGDAKKPDDYLESFKLFITSNINKIPALTLVTQRPRDLTRKQLKELKLILDQQGFSEVSVRVAWRDKTNQDIAASIIGYIRSMALGSPLVPYEQRVANAVNRILASRAWTEPQRKWLERIAKQLKVEVVVDREALDSGEFKAQGGYNRLNKVFNGRLEKVLADMNDEIWHDVA